MWNWLKKREGAREILQSTAGCSVTSFSRDMLETERVSANCGLCRPGHFDRSSHPSDEPALRHALDFFVDSMESETDLDAWTLNRSLIMYLRGVTHMPFVLTVGWYELGGRAELQHTREAANEAVRASDAARLNAVMHIWLTSHAFEIIDVTMPARLDPRIWHLDHRTLAFYFRYPSANDNLVYHPTAIVDDTNSLRVRST